MASRRPTNPEAPEMTISGSAFRDGIFVGGCMLVSQLAGSLLSAINVNQSIRRVTRRPPDGRTDSPGHHSRFTATLLLRKDFHSYSGPQRQRTQEQLSRASAS